MVEAGIEFYTALLGVQTELDSIKKNKKAHTWKYGDTNAIMENIREILANHKILISPYRWTLDTGVFLRTRLIHTPSGQGIEDVSPLPSYSDKEWDDQEIGKNITYHKRYALQILLNLTFDDDKSDDDGVDRRKKKEAQISNKSNDHATDLMITREQVLTLTQLLSSCDNGSVLEANIKKFNNASALTQLTQPQYEKALGYIKKELKAV